MPTFELNTPTVVDATQVIDAVALGGYGYLVDQGPTGPDFTNYGSITFTQAAGQTGATALQLAPGSGIDWNGATVDNEGHITVVGVGSGIFMAADSAPTVTNGGVISVTGAAVAEGFDLAHNSEALPGYGEGGLAFTNSGQLLVSGAGVVNGMYLGDGGYVNNTGLISAGGDGANAVVHGIYSHVSVLLNNSGQIIAADNAPDTDSVAIQVNGGINSIYNKGIISGDIAFEDTSVSEGYSDRDEINNYGTINGRIIMAPHGIGGTISGIANSGIINGDVNFGSSDDAFFGEAGVQNGLISGGAGNDTEHGGAGIDFLQGNTGDDNLLGYAGDDIVVGGKDNDNLGGNDGNDVVWGNLGNDGVGGGDGNDQVRGGQGDDVVDGGAGDDYVSGDLGADTITGGAGADVFHGFQNAGVDKVMDFHVAEGDRVMLDPGTTYTWSQVGADTVIDMGGGNKMILVGVQLTSLPSGWIFEA